MEMVIILKNFLQMMTIFGIFQLRLEPPKGFQGFTLFVKNANKKDDYKLKDCWKDMKKMVDDNAIRKKNALNAIRVQNNNHQPAGDVKGEDVDGVTYQISESGEDTDYKTPANDFNAKDGIGEKNGN